MDAEKSFLPRTTRMETDREIRCRRASSALIRVICGKKHPWIPACAGMTTEGSL